ncbi:MAG: glycoside hydrolase family 30 protein [Flavobacterium sp.]
MRIEKYFSGILFFVIIMACQTEKTMNVEVYETSAAGNQLTKLEQFNFNEDSIVVLSIQPEETFQTITGIGGSFTEATAYLLLQLSEENRNKVLEAYFGETGAKYSLTRTHIASCDFSLSNYTYAPLEGDMNLEHFSIEEDLEDLIPIIQAAQKMSKDGFNIIASPWTAPPWMKDNNHWVGGKLLPEFQETFALYFSKYLQAYKEQGIDIWGVTPVNEPHGNGNNWESMHFTPKEMTDFVQFHLGPQFEKDGWGRVKILGYDQNRAGLKEWVDVMFENESTSKYYAGTAVHWYESTYDYFGEALQYAHQKAPDKHLIQTEGCVDAEVPHWKNDAWYWSKEATDWGWDWAAEDEKYLHPKYVPVHRYAGDMIGCFNNFVDGWIDWNMVLDRQGGPNWFKNWCVAPVIVDPELDEVYFTPLYYTMVHFSKYIRPGAVRIGFQLDHDVLKTTAVKNPDGSIAVVLFNPGDKRESVELRLNGMRKRISIDAQALQTLLIQ